MNSLLKSVFLWTLTLCWSGCSDWGSTLIIGEENLLDDATQPVEVEPDPSSEIEPARCLYQVEPSGLGSGQSWEDSANLHEAMEYLAAALLSGTCQEGELWLAAGTHNAESGSSFELISGMSLYGGFAGGETTLNQRNPNLHRAILMGDAAHIVVMRSQDMTEARLDGVTLQGGRAHGAQDSANGGGVLVVDSRIRLVDIEFISNEALGHGGALFAQGSVVSVENARFVSNTAVKDGGAVALVGSTFIATGIEFVANRADRGGGIFINGGLEVRIENSTWLTQVARQGGAIFDSASQALILTRAKFQNNQGYDAGGAVYFAATQEPLLGNAVLVGNSAPRGASIFVDSVATGRMAGLTLAGNQPGTEGANIEVVDGSLQVVNSILWENQIETRAGEGGALLVSWSVAPESVVGEELLRGDPRFVRAPGEVVGVDADLSLRTDSLAIDSGSNSLIPAGLETVDAAGASRKRDDPQAEDSGEGNPPLVDRGAFEH